MFNYYGSPRTYHQIDSVIEPTMYQKFIKIANSAISEKLKINLHNFEELFIDYVIPSIDKFHKSVLGKLDKYPTENRLTVIVFYGHYSEKMYNGAGILKDFYLDKFNSYISDHKENVRFIDIMELGRLISSDLNILKKIEDLNNLITASLYEEDKLVKLERLSDTAIYDLKKSGCYLGKR